MGLGQVVPGRYKAQIKDWGMNENERMDGALEAWISFDFKDQANEAQSITWKGFVQTREGNINKKTATTLETCGAKLMDAGMVDMVHFMDSDGLDTTIPVDITIIDQPSKDGTKVYKNVEWVNAVGSAPAGQLTKPTGDAKKSIESRLANLGLGKMKPKVKNHAPGAEPDPEIPF